MSGRSVAAVLVAGWLVGSGWGQAAGAGAGAGAAGPAAQAVAANGSCKVDRAETSAAQKALAREEYDLAAELYGKMKGSAPSESRAGTVRVLLAEDKVAEAQGLAEAWVAETPKNAAALETLAEVQLRAGQPTAAYLTAKEAVAADVCFARAFLVYGEFEDMSGYFAFSKRHFEMAHRLAPGDLDIRQAWMATLPKKKRLEEERAALSDESLMNAKDRARLRDSIDHAGDYNRSDCSLATPVQTAKIPIQRIMDGPYRVQGLALDVKFNDKRRRLEIDTGASGLLLSRSAASSLGLTRERQVETGGIGDKGKVATSIAHVASLKIGGLEFHNCVVRILEKSSALDIDGLIGGNVFSKFLVSLDFPKSELRLDPLPPRPEEKAETAALKTADSRPETPGVESGDSVEEPVHDRYVAPEMKDWEPIFRVGHDLLLRVSIGEAKNRLFIVDTGAESTLISPDAARSVTKVKGDSEVRIRGISGEVEKVFQTGKFKIHFANLVLPVEAMTAIDTTHISHNAGVEVSGFMGATVLNLLTVHIDYRDNLMKFDYVPKN